MGQSASSGSCVGIEGKTHIREVVAEDEMMMYRRGMKLLDGDADAEVQRKVNERLRFCCEEKWKDYLRCMEGRPLSTTNECRALKEVADVCIERLNRDQITANMSKRYVMGFLQGESRIRSRISLDDWARRMDVPEDAEAAPAQ
eukprot:TRINITY_DN33291_c0_g1_i1.p2 TRINITY_DN33291_c0_g1~~TRINITY_DN33291_c0_g1_i1.p2  ORF type:complete len:164 (+),score=64.40 TRINITY_DN33291_c0_g1_i1:62-493(+)